MGMIRDSIVRKRQEGEACCAPLRNVDIPGEKACCRPLQTSADPLQTSADLCRPSAEIYGFETPPPLITPAVLTLAREKKRREGEERVSPEFPDSKSTI